MKKAPKPHANASKAGAELKVEYLTLYAFSARNPAAPENRGPRADEVAREILEGKNAGTTRKNVRLQAIGRLTDLPDVCQRQLHKSIEATANNTGLTLVLALSYGGRLEIIDGIKSLLRAVELGHIDRAMIDVEMFSKHLYTRYYPDPDLLIRTSGEMRLSNFLLWQLSYTEITSPRNSGRISKKGFMAAVEEFGRRQRRLRNPVGGTRRNASGNRVGQTLACAGQNEVAVSPLKQTEPRRIR